jgi:hypothetical protein
MNLKRAPAWYTFAVGGFLFLQGTSTLLAQFVPAFDRALPALLETTKMTPIHSTLHIVTGIVAFIILRWGIQREAFNFAFWFGLFYTLLGTAGLLTGGTFGLGLQPFDHPFHLVAGAPGLIAAALAYKQNSSTRQLSP